MKIYELKSNYPLEIIEVSKHTVYSPFSFNSDELLIDRTISQDAKIKTKIFTDGDVAVESDEKTKSINHFYINNNLYPYDVDTLKTKNLYFQNHSFVITYLIASEILDIGNIHGWFDVIKDVNIYLENKNDKTALKSAKEAIKAIENNRSSFNSIFDVLLSSKKENKIFVSDKLTENVYSLKKIKKR